MPSPKRQPSRANAPAEPSAESPSALIDHRIAELADWRGPMLARLRAIIQAADPAVVEEWKWSVPVWSCGGIICTGESYKKVVKLTFAKGASLADPVGLFNSSLEGNVRRAIDFAEGAAVDEAALTALVRAAIALNQAAPARGKAEAPPVPPVPMAPAPEKIAEPPGNLAARSRAFAKRSGSR